MFADFKTLIQLLDYFKDDKVCQDWLANFRWGSTPTCPKCGNIGAYKCKVGFKCKGCRKMFSVTSGSIFDNTKLPLRYWYATMYLVCVDKKGVTSTGLAEKLGIMQCSAYYLLQKVRTLLNSFSADELSGTVQLDETFVGGKNKNRHIDKKVKNSQGRSFKDKTPVMGMLQQREIELKTRNHKLIKGRIVIEKLVKRKSIVKLAVIRSTGVDDLPSGVVMATFDGKLFQENGGYRKKKKLMI